MASADSYTLYNQHKGSNVIIPCSGERGARLHAEASARLGYDGFYRLFHDEKGFVTAFSVLGGVVREHKDVTIPGDHW